jgi:predicted O-methyltransferase YrrM
LVESRTRPRGGRTINASTTWFLEGDEAFAGIWEQVQPHTTASPESGYALYQAVRYLAERPIRGNIVESGIGRGGSSMLIALTLMAVGDTDRDLWLFDAFAERPEPEPVDVDLGGATAELADRVAVEANLASTGYPMDRVHLVDGDIRETAAKTRTGALSLLRLDTDWYSSTAAELTTFWPRLNQHGVLLVDDYREGHGVKAAVDEHFDNDQQPSVLLQPVDDTGRLVVRSTVNAIVPWPARYDHRPAQFDTPDLFDRFPQLVDTDPRTCPDPRLRKQVPHIWRTDTREAHRTTGVISTEEAAVLHAAATTRPGRAGIEIGSHFGWSTAHIAAAGIDLDAVDPAFGDPERIRQVSENLAEWITAGTVRLWPGFSPGILDAVAATRDEPYGFAFVDGLHSEEGPSHDVIGLEPHLADDALVLFHDLTFPDVASAVRLLKSRGWNIRLYNTMQVMAAAWRSGDPPPVYGGDRAHPHGLPADLRDLAT